MLPAGVEQSLLQFSSGHGRPEEHTQPSRSEWTECGCRGEEGPRRVWVLVWWDRVHDRDLKSRSKNINDCVFKINWQLTDSIEPHEKLREHWLMSLTFRKSAGPRVRARNLPSVSIHTPALADAFVTLHGFIFTMGITGGHKLTGQRTRTPRTSPTRAQSILSMKLTASLTICTNTHTFTWHKKCLFYPSTCMKNTGI